MLDSLEEGWDALGVRNIAVLVDNTGSVPSVLARILDLGVIDSQCTRMMLPGVQTQRKQRQSNFWLSVAKPNLRQSQSQSLTLSSLTLEVGDGDLELSSLALSSSYGDIVTSGTVVNSASWNDEGLERIVKSADRGLFPSDTRRFGMDAASLRWGFLLFTVPSPHPSAKVKMKYIFRDQSMEIQRVRCCYFRIRKHLDSVYNDFIQHKTTQILVMITDWSPHWWQEPHCLQ